MKCIALFATTLFLLCSALASAAELHFFVGAGLRQPVDRLIEAFQLRTGHQVVVDYDGGGRLLARITASGRGDLFMPGSFFYIEKLQAQHKILSCRLVVAHTPVVAVNRTRTDRLNRFEDLAKPGIRLGLGDPEAMAFGKTAMKILQRCGLKDEILANVAVYGATVKQLALYVAEGDVDASIVGRADAFQFSERVAVIPIPSRYFEAETVAVAVLRTAADQKAAEALQNFLSSPEAINFFNRFGFLPLK